MTNRLADSISPYLQQHAGNPVDWHTWGARAFDLARERDVPVFLSVGYAACHWCHVMAHESFEDPATARLLNERFVSVKVDREERPDIDAVYMAATTALTGRGGWPMSVWLDHEGRAFHAGTYFPPQPAPGLPSFTEVLLAVSQAWTQRRAEVSRAAEHIDAVLRRREEPESGSGPVAGAAETIAAATAALWQQYDQNHGGFGAAPKFPPAMLLPALFRVGPADERAAAMAAATCEAMARGGIHDQLAGGFARYSVDASWTVPHFEKMLYDNALLAGACTDWWAATGSPLAAQVCEQTLEFLRSDLELPGGGFAASLDADAPPAPGAAAREGATYVWRPDELTAVLGDSDGRWAAGLTGVTAAGSFEDGTSVLQLRSDPDDPDRWRECRARLLAARRRRPQPARDDKLVASWNALTISALVSAGLIFRRPEWVSAAVRAGEVLRDVHMAGDRLARVSRDGVAGPAAGVLADYALTAEAFLALQRATGDAAWYSVAEVLVEAMVDRFCEEPPDGPVFFDTARDAEQLVRRPRDTSDGATPSGAAAAAKTLIAFAAIAGRRDLRRLADGCLERLQPQMAQQPRFSGWALRALQLAAAGPLEIAVVGQGEGAAELLATAERVARGRAVIVSGPASGGAGPVPLLVGRTAPAGGAAAYVCRDFTCGLPVADSEALVAALR